MTVDNDMLFEFDPLDINEDPASLDVTGPRMSFGTGEPNPVLLKVQEHVKVSWQTCQETGSRDIHRAVANALCGKYGYSVVVRCTQGAAKAPDFLKQLRHQFLVLLNVPGLEGQEVVVDWNFVDNFVLARTTPRFASVLTQLPPFFVGTAATLADMVCAVAAEMKLVCHEHNMPLPPWRQEEGLLSKWLSPTSTDLARFYGAGVYGESPTSVLVCVSEASSLSPTVGAALQYTVVPTRIQQQPTTWDPRRVVTGFSGTTITAAKPVKRSVLQLESILGPLCTVKLAG